GRHLIGAGHRSQSGAQADRVLQFQRHGEDRGLPDDQPHRDPDHHLHRQRAGLDHAAAVSVLSRRRRWRRAAGQHRMERNRERGRVSPDDLRMGVTMRRSLLALAVAVLLASPAAAQITPYASGPTGQSSLALTAPTAISTDSSNRIATTAWVNNWLASAMPLASGKIWIGSVGNVATPQTPSGDLTVSNAGVFTFGTVNANVGSFGSATQCASVTVNAKGLITAA